MPVQTQYFPLGGGLNLVDPPISMQPGMVVGAENYEVGVRGGYKRIDGYERFDGRNKPSAATYWVLNFDAGDTAISEGDLIGDSASPTIQGEALIDAVLTSGSYAGSDAAGYVVVMSVSGKTAPSSFADDDPLYVGAGQVAVTNGAPSSRGATTDADDTTWLRDAIDTTRTKIGVVPGSGDVRGVHIYKSKRYAVRDNAGGTAGVLHVESTSGWTAVDLGGNISLTSGNWASGEPVVGETVTGGTSGAGGTVTYVSTASGDWTAGTAVATIYLKTITNSPFQAEALTFSGGGTATCDGAETAHTLPAGGRYEFHNANFTGHAGTVKVYGVNGVGTGFEFDGSAFIPIITGMTTDTPIHVIEHKKQLFFAFANGSTQHSGVGTPLVWSPITGASEIGTSDEVTGYLKLPGDTLAIMNRNSTYILYGSGSSDWELRKHSATTGGIEWSLQRIGLPIYGDDRGITTLNEIQEYGDFSDNTISQLVTPSFIAKKNLIQASCISREKNQYRLFFSDATAMYVTFDNRQVSGIMPIELGKAVTCITSLENGSGDEEIYFGSTDGYVYQMDKGTSFDGAVVSAFLRVVFNHMNTPERRKRFRKAVFEMDTTLGATIQFTPAFSYDSEEFAAANAIDISVDGGGGFWNVDNWDEFYWSNPGVPRATAKIDGTGTNLGMTIYHEQIYENPHTIHGATIHYSQRRYER